MASPKATLNIVQTVVFSTAETAINQYAALFLSTSADMTARLPAAAALPVPIEPEAPPRLSTTSGWPST